jgi:ATP synthase protein I
MSEEQPSSSLKNLDERIRGAKERRSKGKTKSNPYERGSGLSLALRIGVELVSALFIGVAVGLGLDKWLDTTPWFLLLFFLLGAAAGILNVFRTMTGYGYAAGYRKGENEDASQDAQDRNG